MISFIWLIISFFLFFFISSSFISVQVYTKFYRCLAQISQLNFLSSFSFTLSILPFSYDSSTNNSNSSSELMIFTYYRFSYSYFKETSQQQAQVWYYSTYFKNVPSPENNYSSYSCLVTLIFSLYSYSALNSNLGFKFFNVSVRTWKNDFWGILTLSNSESYSSPNQLSFIYFTHTKFHCSNFIFLFPFSPISSIYRLRGYQGDSICYTSIGLPKWISLCYFILVRHFWMNLLYYILKYYNFDKK